MFNYSQSSHNIFQKQSIHIISFSWYQIKSFFIKDKFCCQKRFRNEKLWLRANFFLIMHAWSRRRNLKRGKMWKEKLPPWNRMPILLNSPFKGYKRSIFEGGLKWNVKPKKLQQKKLENALDIVRGCNCCRQTCHFCNINIRNTRAKLPFWEFDFNFSNMVLFNN